MVQRNFKITWNVEAENLLRRRGNYTLEQIHKEFERDPKKEALLFDTVHHCFVTPVANHRYSVVWRMFPDRNEAEVSAVVPTRFVAGGDLQALKERVKSVVSLETDGRVTLDP
jgi:hypothetical protein